MEQSENYNFHPMELDMNLHEALDFITRALVNVDKAIL
jgi:hypothetical protein